MDPVLAADGMSYERSSIADWLARGNVSSPWTGAPLEHLHLVANIVLRGIIQDALAARGDS